MLSQPSYYNPSPKPPFMPLFPCLCGLWCLCAAATKDDCVGPLSHVHNVAKMFMSKQGSHLEASKK